MKRNLPCELHVGDDCYPATTVDVDENRLLIQCDATVAPGTNVDVHFPRMTDISAFWLKTCVARGSSRGPRAIALRIVEAPPVYQVLTMPGVEIEVEGAPPPRVLADQQAHPVVLLDAGDLGPVAAALDSMDIEYSHVVAHKGQLPIFAPAERLFITSARLTFTHPMPSFSDDETLIGVAVAETSTQTLVRNIQRLGFRYLVTLPFHSDAFALLLRQALFRERDKRAAARRPVGIEVTWRTGLRRRRATLIDISETGGRLHTASPEDAGTALRLTIPARAGAGQPLRLRGRIVRRERLHGRDLAEPYALALQWEGIDGRSAARLAKLLEVRALGPVPLEAAQQEAALPSGSAEPPPPPVPGDRRATPRAELGCEVVSLGDSNTVEHVFECRDISETGMRIDPHPSLSLGLKLRMGLLDPSDPAPIVVDAEVVRDADAAGMGLRFQDVPPEVAERLAALVSTLPAVQSLQPRPQRVVFGRIVESDPTEGPTPNPDAPNSDPLPEREGGA